MTVPPSKFDWEDLSDAVIHHGDFIQELFKRCSELEQRLSKIEKSHKFVLTVILEPDHEIRLSDWEKLREDLIK